MENTIINIFVDIGQRALNGDGDGAHARHPSRMKPSSCLTEDVTVGARDAARVLTISPIIVV